jgi:predicted nucleic acid-binding Zn ribbon protein
MPIYEYEPTVFSEEEQVNECCFFECLQSVSEEKLAQCQTCGSPVHRVVSGFFSNSSGLNSPKQNQQGGQGLNAGFAEKFGHLFSSDEKKVLLGQKNLSEFQQEQKEEGIFQKSSSTDSQKASKVAKMMARHICNLGCKH